MPIDPNIVSGLAPAAANLSQMGTFAQQQTAAQSQREYRDKQRKEQQIAEILGSSADDDEKVNQINALDIELGSKFRTQLDTHREKARKLFSDDLANDKAKIQMAARLMQGVRDKPTMDAARQMIGSLGDEGPQLAAMLPPEWDEATSPALIQALVDKGMEAEQYTDRQQKALDRSIKGEWRHGLAEALATSDDPAEAQGALAGWKAMGAPKVDTEPFEALVQNWSPDAKKKAGEMALSEQQRQTLAGQAATRDEAAAQRDIANARADQQLAISQEHLNLSRQANARAAQGGGASGGDTGDAKAIAAAIISGDQPPSLTGLYRFAAPVRAELARKGYDLTRATEDWTATQKHLSTLNGAQQTRLRQAVSFTKESVPLIRSLVTEWDSAGLPLLSKVNLEAAASGAYGNKQQSLARRLKGQIADLTSELGTVYKGGNSSTDESLKLAAENLQADWSKKAALDALTQIEKNLQFRENSIRNVGPIGGRDQNPYAPERGGGGAIAEGTEKPVPGHPGVVAVYRGGRWIVK